MTLVLAAGSVLDTDPLGVLEVAAAAGFDGVGLRLSAAPAHDPARIAAAAAALGLVVHDVEVHRISPHGARPEPLLDAAAAVGGRAVLVVSDLSDRTATVDAVGELVGLAGERGLTVGLEYMAWTDPSTPLEALAVARATGATVVVDVLHHCRVGAGPAELAMLVESGLLGWLQLCDAPAAAPAELIDEARHGRLPPGDGGLPVGDLLNVLPPTATISVEVQSNALLSTVPAARARLLADSARRVLGER